LPEHIKNVQNITTFKNKLKDYVTGGFNSTFGYLMYSRVQTPTI